MKYILYNPLASNKKGREVAERFVLEEGIKQKDGEIAYRDIVQTDVRFFLGNLYPDDEVFIVGGGGTINKFAQNVKGVTFKNNIYFAPSGVGNDFFNDIAKPGEKYAKVNDYIKQVHTTTINGKKYPFLTDVGIGVDGYSCAVGNAAREKDGSRDFNYSMAVIKGVLGKYKPCPCSVIVDDGEEEYFENVWMASTMSGTSYGGGVKIAPTYNRLTADYLELIIFTAPSPVQALAMFPSVIKGTHEGKKGINIFRGKKIEVYFTQPRDAQIDGDSVLGVQKYLAEF